MDNLSRRKQKSAAAIGDANPQNVHMMALVIGVMSAVTAEVEKVAEQEVASHRMAGMIKMLPLPHQELTPEQVLKIQLAALKMNDVPADNNGVRTAHRFCTAESRAILGTPEQFTLLFRDPMYSPLLNFQSLRFDGVYRKGSRACIQFTVTCGKGSEAHYIAHLVIEEDGPDKGCWMTDSILRRCS